MTKQGLRLLLALLVSVTLLFAFMLSALQVPSRAQVCEGLRQDILVRGPQSAQRLAVVLHGMRMEPKALEPLIDTLLKAPGYEDTHIFAPRLPFSVLSTARAEDITACLVDFVDQAWRERRATGSDYRSVLLVGHSMGSLFARKLYVVARGELVAAPFEKSLRTALGLPEVNRAPVPPREWAQAVDRIVLLGAINRGWSVDHHMPFARMFEMQAGLTINRLIQAMGGPPFTVMATRKGAPFVTQLRLQWLEMMDCEHRRLALQPSVTEAANTTSARATGLDAADYRCSGRSLLPVAPVAQLLGTQDDLIPPGDGIDPVAGRAFAYFEVPHSDHRTVVEMGDEAPGAPQRKAAFVRALQHSVEAGHVAPELVAARGAPDFDVKHVVFVIHGIRDEGFWTERLGARVRTRLKEQPECKDQPPCEVKLEVSSYGYFPMLSFLKPGSRNEKVEWLVDRYAQARAQYPNAKEPLHKAPLKVLG